MDRCGLPAYGSGLFDKVGMGDWFVKIHQTLHLKWVHLVDKSTSRTLILKLKQRQTKSVNQYSSHISNLQANVEADNVSFLSDETKYGGKSIVKSEVAKQLLRRFGLWGHHRPITTKILEPWISHIHLERPSDPEFYISLDVISKEALEGLLVTVSAAQPQKQVCTECALFCSDEAECPSLPEDTKARRVC